MNYIIKNLLFVEDLTQNGHDCVLADFGPKNHIGRIITCYIDVRLLMKETKSFPCNNGEFMDLSDENRLEIAEFARTMLFHKKCSVKNQSKITEQFNNLFQNLESIQNELQTNL